MDPCQKDTGPSFKQLSQAKAGTAWALAIDYDLLNTIGIHKFIETLIHYKFDENAVLTLYQSISLQNAYDL